MQKQDAKRGWWHLLRGRWAARPHSGRLVLLTLAFLLVASEAFAARGLKQSCYMVPMRDGTRLATDVYVPRVPRGPYPVVLVRTPFGKHDIKRIYARYVCRRGWGVVVQDMRGRYQSQGSGVPMLLHDGWGANGDGHDTIRWIARQCWCNGKVATWGPSALGVAQNLLAPGASKALKAQHVMLAFSDMYSQAAYEGGVFQKALVEGFVRRNHFDPRNVDFLLAHPKYDEFWAALNAEAQAHRVNVPAVFWGGWYDVFQQGTINSFVTIQHQGGPRAQGNCRLIIGPWSHGDVQRLIDPRNARCWPRAGDPLRFFDYWVKGTCNGVPYDKRVHYYVMGERCNRSAPGNFWRSADDWPPPSRPTNFYFHADRKLRRTAPVAPDAALCYKFDPNHPVPTRGGRNLTEPVPGPLDQRSVESRPDVLLFTTDPLARPLEVTGRLSAKLYVSSDCPDTDFTVKLTDVYPDGRSIILADGIRRARHRESFERDDFLEPGKIYELTVDLWSTSIIFNRGHKIRVAVSSSNYPRFEANPNTGRSWRETPERRIATNTLHLSSEHPSHIILPVYRPRAASR